MNDDDNNNNDDSDGSSSLDHALLESLFYNEMMMMGGDAIAAATEPESNLAASYPPAAATASQTGSTGTPDPSALAERAMLYDFGVHDGGVARQAAVSNGHHAVAYNAVSAVPPAAAVAPGIPHALQQQQPPVPSLLVAPAAGNEGVSQERAQQLVSQFATLASRLGISLPPNVLASLTATAAANTAKGAPFAASATAPQPIASAFRTAAEDPTPPLVKQLQSTAEAAIAAVSHPRKRASPDQDTSKPTAASNGKSAYSKRRKKPRLSDVETKLAQLKEENEMLKRHLASVTTRSTKLEEERKQAEQEMRRRLQEGDPKTLPPLLSKFGEMYSDYGQHRHDELSFHLGQLEKLAAPTNFTKMGLWTLGQSEHFYTNPKRNPIAGILRKELNISPTQGRKILEQRQKIRDVCANLKECLVLLGKLKAVCEHKQKIFSDRMSKCQEILTPLQVVKLMLWVDENADQLDSVCPGWGSERLRPKQPPPSGDPSRKPPPPPPPATTS